MINLLLYIYHGFFFWSVSPKQMTEINSSRLYLVGIVKILDFFFLEINPLEGLITQLESLTLLEGLITQEARPRGILVNTNN